MNKILVDLDSYFDTRLATLFSIDKKAITEMLHSGEYHKRLYDNYPGINTELFKHKYSNRDKNILANSTLTNIPNIILDYILNLKLELKEDDKIELILNIHPYKLTDYEITNIIIAMVYKTSKLVDIKIIDMSPEELTPKYLSKDYALLIMYNFLDWFELHSDNDNFLKDSLPETSALIPLIFTEEPDDMSEVVNIISAMESYFTTIISARFIGIENFSTTLNIEKLKYK